MANELYTSSRLNNFDEDPLIINEEPRSRCNIFGKKKIFRKRFEKRFGVK